MKNGKRYGSYTTKIDGKDYAIVYIPQENGRYKKKVKLLSLIEGNPKTKAQQWAWSELEKAQQVVSPRTFEDVAGWYRQEFLVAPVYRDGKKLYGARTYKAQRRTLDILTAAIGDLNIDKVTVDVLSTYKRKALRSVSISTVNRRFALLRTVLRKAKQRKWMSENPFDVDDSLIQVSLESRRVSSLDDKTVDLLIEKSATSEQPLLKYLIVTLADTGARPSEIYPYDGSDREVPREPLNWERVLKYDFRGLDIVSYKSRIRQVRFVPTTERLELALRELHSSLQPTPQAQDLLFPVTTLNRS